MTGPDVSDPDDFSQFVVEALHRSPTPDPARLESAKQLWELRILGEELGRLVSDSANTPLAGVRRRGRGGDRDLMYAFTQCEVSVRVDQARQVSGQVLGADPVTAELVTVEGRRSVQVGPYGRFTDSVRSGPFRIAFSLADGSTVTTPWAVV